MHAGNEDAVAKVAAAIGEPARARMLYCLLDNRARSSTELAVVAGVSPSTTSVHLNRLTEAKLIKALVQGKHRYYSLTGPEVASALEGLSVLAGDPHNNLVPNAPCHLRAARTCYDHIAGTLGVALHDRMKTLGWLKSSDSSTAYDLTREGETALTMLGVDVDELRQLRRRFASACLDWSERRPHVGGAVGAAILKLALKKRWVAQELDSRALRVTQSGRREMQARFGLEI